MQIKKILTLGIISTAILASTTTMAGPRADHAHHKITMKCKKMHKKLDKKIAIAKYKKRHGG